MLGISERYITSWFNSVARASLVIDQVALNKVSYPTEGEVDIWAGFIRPSPLVFELEINQIFETTFQTFAPNRYMASDQIRARSCDL